MSLPQSCSHSTWRAQAIPLSDGRPSLREFCVSCGASSSGSRLGPALPMVADGDITVQSFKYPNVPLKDILEKDPEYLVWLVKESKSSDRIKKSAARLLCKSPYSPPKDGEQYPSSQCYVPTVGWDCIRKILSQP